MYNWLSLLDISAASRELHFVIFMARNQYCLFSGAIDYTGINHSTVGEQIAGYVVKSGEWELIGTRSPQDAQVCLIMGGGPGYEVNSTYIRVSRELKVVMLCYTFVFSCCIQAFYPAANKVEVNAGDTLVSHTHQ